MKLPSLTLLKSLVLSTLDSRLFFCVSTTALLLIGSESPSHASNVQAKVLFRWFDLATSIAPVAETFGRVCIDPLFGAISEDPVGACGGPEVNPTFRNIGGLPANVTLPFPIGMTGTASQLPVAIPNAKRLEVIAAKTPFLLSFGTITAQAVDPIIFPEFNQDRDIGFSLEIEELELNTSGFIFPDPVKFQFNLNANIPNDLEPLFTIDITRLPGEMATVDATVSEFLSNQGWNEVTIESDLTQALSIGDGKLQSGFMLPQFEIPVPMNQALKVENGTLVNFRDVPEPLTILGTATAAGFGAFFKRQINKKKKDKEE